MTSDQVVSTESICPDCDRTFARPLVVAESVAVRAGTDVTSWRVGTLVLTAILSLTLVNVYEQNINSMNVNLSDSVIVLIEK